MRINEVCKSCHMTKKAVEYYVEQGLVFPVVQENGYRDFSEEEADRLKKIAVLRNLGVPVAEIRKVLLSKNAQAWNQLAGKRFLEAAAQRDKQEIFQALAAEENWEKAWKRLKQLEEKRSVLERMLHAFPGYYGRVLCVHFAPFLEEPAATEEQRDAFQTVIDFLDATELEIPGDLQEYLEKATAGLSDGDLGKLSSQVEKALCEIGPYLEAHREEIEAYMEYKQSAEYENTPAGRLEKFFKEFSQKSGYNQVFLPAMRRLSRSYAEYSQRLLEADELFLKQYPKVGEK